MAKNKPQQEFVKEITPRDVDFAQWYTDVIRKTDMVDYAPVRGCMVIKPYGYGIWELIQKHLDAKFKETGHENVYMPMLLPESLLSGVRTLTANIVLEMGYATDLHREALIACGVVLFVFILIINLCFSAVKRKADAT